MKIVFVHGAQQQKMDAPQLQDYWLNIFQLGLNHSAKHIELDTLDISFPYYGDLLFKHMLSFSTEPINLLGDTWQEWHLPFLLPDESQPVDDSQPLISLTSDTDEELSFTSKLYLFSHLAKDRVLKEFVVLLNKFPKLHESVIQKLIIEAYLYLASPDFMQDVHKRIASAFDSDDEYIIVAHSLGTVIAYNLLQQLPHIRVQRFITLASPLAFQVIQSKLNMPVERPRSLIGDWHNFYSQEDYLTTFPLDQAPFDFHPPIENQLISTFVNRPHEIIGYLQHPSVIERIVEPLYPDPALYLDYG
ncbi:hypothetical protein [Acinetobacter soli]|uniref:hypothetical protein n=1 Tax=Acinetobacter soli TaxID=487316 RepID=UPI0032B4CB26